MHQLHGAAVLEINTGYHHVKSFSPSGEQRHRFRLDIFKFSQTLNAIVENRGGQRCVGSTFAENFEERFGSVRTARGDHRDVYGAGNCRCQFAIESRSCAVLIHRRNQDFSGAAIHSAARPCDCVHASGHASPAHEGFPVVADALGVYRQDNGLRTELCRQGCEQIGITNCGCVYCEFVGTGAEDCPAFLDCGYTAACGERDCEFSSDSANRFEKRGAMVAGRGNVQDYEFVSAFDVVARSQGCRISRIAEIDELHALYDALAVGIEARNDAVREANRLPPA